jgi:hypothetical protein
MGNQRLERLPINGPGAIAGRITAGGAFAIVVAWLIRDAAAFPTLWRATSGPASPLRMMLLLTAGVLLFPRLIGWRWRNPASTLPFIAFALAMFSGGRAHHSTLLEVASTGALGWLLYAGYRREHPGRILLSSARTFFKVSAPVEGCRARLRKLGREAARLDEVGDQFILRFRRPFPLGWLAPTFHLTCAASDGGSVIETRMAGSVELFMLAWWASVPLLLVILLPEPGAPVDAHLTLTALIGFAVVGLALPIVALLMRSPDESKLEALLGERLDAVKSEPGLVTVRYSA